MSMRGWKRRSRWNEESYDGHRIILPSLKEGAPLNEEGSELRFLQESVDCRLSFFCWTKKLLNLNQ